jgi:putative Mn2+ efflux pump MntP
VDTLTLMVTAFALAMDAFAVSVASGVSLKKVTLRQTFSMSWHFGFFQALMPVIGWSAGLTVRSFIEHYDHWVAFLLLAVVGGHMIRESFQKEQDKKEKNDPTRGMTLLMPELIHTQDIHLGSRPCHWACCGRCYRQRTASREKGRGILPPQSIR